MEKIPYQLIRSDRKTIQMRLDENLQVVVRAPRRMSARAIDDFVQSHADWVAQARPKVEEWYKTHPEPTEAQKQWCIRELKKVLPGKLEHYAARMGVTPGKVRITGARTRFGSCNSQGNLCFSWRLRLYPTEVTDALVVHELAHLKQMNHQKAFYDEVYRILPDYQARIALLKQPPNLPDVS